MTIEGAPDLNYFSYIFIIMDQSRNLSEHDYENGDFINNS